MIMHDRTLLGLFLRILTRFILRDFFGLLAVQIKIPSSIFMMRWVDVYRDMCRSSEILESFATYWYRCRTIFRRILSSI
nr:unnamed protein product [Callosobruchus chinensis]